MSTRLIVFLIVLGAQVAVPMGFILKHERTLLAGQTHRFRTAPVDPIDPFQGRYVIINLADQQVNVRQGIETRNLHTNRRGFAQFETDEDGFSYFSNWSIDRPPSGEYLRTKLAKHGQVHAASEKINGSWRIEIPFNRYYMKETLAPLAERLVQQRDREIECWVEVKLLNGHAVVSQLFIDGLPVQDAIRSND